jgi:molybdopterin molybdotransferase
VDEKFMTAQSTLNRAMELTPLADYLANVLRRLRPLPTLDLELGQAYGHVLAEEVRAAGPVPAFDITTIDGYAARSDDVAGASNGRPVRLSVVGDLGAASWRPVRVAPGTCFAVAAGAPLPAAADVVVPPAWTDQGMAAVEIREAPKRGHGVRRTGAEIASGELIAGPGTMVTPGLIGALAATGVGHLVVRPHPRVAIVATGDELVEAGRISQPGQIADANSQALGAAAVEAGAHAYRIGICDDDPERLRTLLEDQTMRSDLIVTSGGTGTGPGDIVRRILGREGAVRFTDLSVFPCPLLGFGTLTSTMNQADEIPVVCLPGDPGAALVGFEILARPVIQMLAGTEPVFRPSVRAHLLETIASPLGLREFRPALVLERRGGGYTVQPMPGGPYTLSGLAGANGLIVLGERVGSSAAGSTVDVLLLDRRR